MKFNMKYLQNYGINEEQLNEIKERYNDGIIEFISEEKEFVTEKLEYLQKKGYIIFPILNNNIKIFLEEMSNLENHIKRMETKGYSKKVIQMILMDEQQYNKN